MRIRVSSPGLAVRKDTLSGGDLQEDDIVRWFGERIRGILQQAVWLLKNTEIIEEIRLRVNQPLLIRTGKKEYFLLSSGQLGMQRDAYLVTKEDLIETLEKMTYSSIYAAEEELRQGFLTLPGGHRVGISGETVVEYGKIRILRNISGLNIRLARQPRVNMVELLRLLIDQDKVFYDTLLVSPPRAGKTTMLRLLIRQLSEGVPVLGLEGQTVGVVDERSEIAGMWQGIPTFDLGCRTDVLDRCPKAEGLIMLIRSMSPSVIAVDELGSVEDASALGEAVRCGVKILATAHASSLEELYRRAHLKELFSNQTFERMVVLSRERGPGTLEGVYDTQTGRNLLKD